MGRAAVVLRDDVVKALLPLALGAVDAPEGRVALHDGAAVGAGNPRRRHERSLARGHYPRKRDGSKFVRARSISSTVGALVGLAVAAVVAGPSPCPHRWPQQRPGGVAGPSARPVHGNVNKAAPLGFLAKKNPEGVCWAEDKP